MNILIDIYDCLRQAAQRSVCMAACLGVCNIAGKRMDGFSGSVDCNQIWREFTPLQYTKIEQIRSLSELYQ